MGFLRGLLLGESDGRERPPPITQAQRNDPTFMRGKAQESFDAHCEAMIVIVEQDIPTIFDRLQNEGDVLLADGVEDLYNEAVLKLRRMREILHHARTINEQYDLGQDEPMSDAALYLTQTELRAKELVKPYGVTV